MVARHSRTIGVLLVLLLALAKGAAAADADERVAWLRAHAIPLVPASASSDDFADLERLRPAIGDARIVMLGEPTRGSGSALAMKARLVRFLHQRMGFDVLAFEGGFYDCARAGEAIRTGAEPRRALVGALFPQYAQAAELQPVFDLLAASAATDRPLVVEGVDDQIGGRAGADELLAGLRAALAAAGIDAARVSGWSEVEAAVRDVVAERYATGEVPVPPRASQRRVLATLDDLRRRLEARPTRAASPGAAGAPSGSNVDPAFWAQVLANLSVYAESGWQEGKWEPDAPQKRKTALTNRRDRQMAENLVWLARRRHPDRKIVVWSLNVHLARDLDLLTTSEAATRARFDEMSMLGDEVRKALGGEVYTIALTALRGAIGAPGRQPAELLAATAGSFEELMGRAGFEAAFVDLRNIPEGGAWLRRGLIARPLSYKELLGIWPRHLDALLFLRTMEPSRPVASP